MQNSNKEVTVFTYGDANSLSTWSNVPFFLTTTFEKMGWKVNRVDVTPNELAVKIWNKIFVRFIKLFKRNTTFYFDRTPFFRKHVDGIMKRAVNDFPDSDFFLSVSFSYSPKAYTKKPCALFCDWTYDYYIKHFLGRVPDFFERQEIRNQQQVIDIVDKVFVLFPDVKKYMQNFYSDSDKFRYLGNVVNSPEYELTSDKIKSKFESRSIVFVGSAKYAIGAKALIQSLQNDMHLDIIGMTRDDVKNVNIPNNVTFYGYLNKSDQKDFDKYYELVNNSKIFVNTTPKWSSFSATLDVMYHGTPVVVSNYRSFENTFGTNISFGYLSENRVSQIRQCLEKIFSLDEDEYFKLCENARKAVENFSWHNFVSKMIENI